MGEVTCIQQLLNLVSHGNAIIAELLRLKDNIPNAFKLETKEDHSKYGEIIFDFSYFKNTDVVEKKISANPLLRELDDELKEANLTILCRFYSAFESVFQYATDLNILLEQLMEGSFIQQTLDTVLQDNEGKQLSCESIYLYGCMLLICEVYIPGNIRERLLVAYHRTAVSHFQTNIDSVCKLLRDTGYRNVQGAKRPNNYPDELFRRIPIDESFINIVIGRLRIEDVYNQSNIYPQPDHRSTALATQAAMLVVCLFFLPNMLQFEAAKMREIVDKYFPDNWIVSLYMGITVNLIDVWDSYKAAKSALCNTINTKNIKEISQKHISQMNKLYGQSEKLLQSISAKEDKWMYKINKSLSLIRECNVTLRWLTIHTIPTVIWESNKKCKQVRDQIIAESKFQYMDLFNFLITSSLLELNVKEILRESLNNKEKKWDEQQREASERIIDICDVFSGLKPLVRVEKNEKLSNWFRGISKQIDSLNRDDMQASTKKIIQIIHELDYGQEFHQLDDIMQIKQWLMETRSNLRDMICGGGFTEDSLVTLQLCTDLSYGWHAARFFIDLGRDVLRKDPKVVSQMRAIFIKLASALEIPLLRINQAASPDLLSVSQYYSNELVSYVKDVLQIIPETVFSLLEKIIDLQTSVIKEIPTRLDKDKLKDYAQLEERMEVAKLTHSLSIFTSGILKMRSTLVGIICIDPKQLLEDGIRREVSKLLAAKLKGSLCNNVDGNLSLRLKQLALHMDGYRRSFEYIQDYINIHGLKIWQEEVSNIINNCINEECTKILKLKSSQPTVLFSKDSNHIFGCLLHDIYALTDPRTTIYVEYNNAWYDFKTHRETATLSLFSLLHQSIGATGSRALSRLLGNYVSVRLSHINTLMQGLQLPKMAIPSPRLPIQNPAKFYTQHSTKFTKSWPNLLEWILEIGTAQLLIKHINYQLNMICKFDSMHLESSLRAVNEAIMNDVRLRPHNRLQLYAELLPELVEMMHCAGICDPYKTVYLKMKHNNIAQIFFLFVITQLYKLEYTHVSSTLTAKRSTNNMDGAPFIVGIVTLLKQHHEYTIIQFVLLLCQYIISYVDAGLNCKNPEFTTEAYVGLQFLENFCRISNIPQHFIEMYIPVNILTQYQFMTSKTI